MLSLIESLYPCVADYPSAPPVFEVCPHCKRPLDDYTFTVNGFEVRTWICPEHGDIAQPMRSAVINQY